MTLRCPACGTRYEGEARFCQKDGSRLQPADHASAAAMDPLPGQLFGGRYRVQRRVGEGGMAVVYRAQDEQTGEALALKVLAPVLTGDATAMARLRREAELGRLLRHPNVCPILAMARGPGGQVYVVMPFLAGETLTERLVRRGPLPPAEGVRSLSALMADGGSGRRRPHARRLRMRWRVYRDRRAEVGPMLGSAW